MGKFGSLEEKVIVIAGGIKNLGGLTARTLANKKVKLVLHYHNPNEYDLTKELEKEITTSGSEVAFFQGKLDSESDVQRLFDYATKSFGKIDVAINTVGKVLKKPIADTTEQEFDEMNVVNNKIAYFFIKHAEQSMTDNGKIITIVTSLLPAYTGLYSTYAGLKAPVEQYTKAASKEYMDRRISVNSIAPGPMDTPFFYGQETKESENYHKSQAIGNDLTKIEDIVPIIEFLILDGWWINGQTIFANGGYTTR